MLRYLRFVAGADLVRLPVILRKLPKNQDPPDFVLDWLDASQETFELTDGSTPDHQKRLSRTSSTRDSQVLPVDINTSEREAGELWAEILFSAFRHKAEVLDCGRFDLDHLLIYDLTGLALLLPLERGAALLRQKLREWHASHDPRYRFRRISVLRDLALLLDVEGCGQVLRRSSPYFAISAIHARDEEDLKKRLRDIDRFCRENSIRHLKTFGSILGDTVDDFREDSDLDLLVEFAPGTRVTLLDMARMERELSQLIGIKVDLRTASDLSRYFRGEVLQEAVELHARR